METKENTAQRKLTEDERSAVEFYTKNPGAALFDMKRRLATPLDAPATAQGKHQSTPSGDAWRFSQRNGRILSTQGWSASHDSSECTCYLPLHKNGKVIALVVASGNYDDLEKDVLANAAKMIEALNRA